MDFLTRLTQRMTGELPTVQPRLQGRFEPSATTPHLEATDLEFETAAETAEVPYIEAAALESETAVKPTAASAPRRRPIVVGQPLEPAAAFPMTRPSIHQGTAVPVPLSQPASTHLADHFITPRVSEDVQRPAEVPALGERPVTRQIAAEPAASTPAAVQPASRLPVQVEVRPAPLPSPLPGAQTLAGERAVGRIAATDAPPTVHVRIGRIDVRAVMPLALPPRPVSRPAAPRTSLEDYLSGRKGGSQS